MGDVRQGCLWQAIATFGSHDVLKADDAEELFTRSAGKEVSRYHVEAMDRQPTRHNKSIFQSFSPNDIKLLVITFAGTVTANIVTVLFVDLAIATAHAFNAAHESLPIIAILPVVTIGSIVVPIITFTSLSRLRHSDSPLKKILIATAIALMGFALYFVLVWVGLAAGIK